MEAYVCQLSPFNSSVKCFPYMKDTVPAAASGRFFQVDNDSGIECGSARSENESERD